MSLKQVLTNNRMWSILNLCKKRMNQQAYLYSKRMWFQDMSGKTAVIKCQTRAFGKWNHSLCKAREIKCSVTWYANRLALWPPPKDSHFDPKIFPLTQVHLIQILQSLPRLSAEKHFYWCIWQWSVTSERTFSALRRLQELHKKHNEAGPSEKIASDHDELSQND